MNYEEARGWGEPPVPQVSREELETLYSYGHYDGPYTGLIRWKGAYWFACRFSYVDYRYWIVALTSEQQEHALRYGKAWAEAFHNGMSWNPDGTPFPPVAGKYGLFSDYGALARGFAETYGERPEPSPEAEVVGYFDGWRA